MKHNCYAVGLTGEIAVGKSYVAQQLVEIGQKKGLAIYHFDVDAVKHQLIKTQEVIDELVDYFGADILSSEGQVDRRILGSKVFGNRNAMEKVKQISEPRMIHNLEYQLAKNTYLLFNGALIIDYEETHYCNHKVIIVTSDRKTQIEQLIHREIGRDVILTPEEAEKRIASQESFESKKIKLSKKISDSKQGWIKVFDNSLEHRGNEHRLEQLFDSTFMRS